MAKANPKKLIPATSPASPTIAPSPAATPAAPVVHPQFKCSIFPSDPLHPHFAQAIQKLQDELAMPVVLLWQDGVFVNPIGDLSHHLCLRFMQKIGTLPANKKVSVLINSPGGQADVAFRIARLIQKRCGSFDAIVPRWAKSAATLFSLGADKIILGRFGELGPLDVQIRDFEREEERSALAVVQSVERLNHEAMTAMDQQMIFWIRRSNKKIETLLPTVSHFVAEMMRPLFDKIDAVEFTKNARLLKVAQDYAIRLLVDHVGGDRAESITSTLTNGYSEHGFVIDAKEAKNVGINNAEEATGKLGTILEELAHQEYGTLNAMGTFEKVAP